MALKFILDKVAAENGINVSDASQRAWLVDKINEAARDIYSLPDIPISLMECYVRATANKELALPPFVGEIRAIRSGCKDFCSDKWTLHTMFPRYTKVEWVNLWKNWRVKGYVPVAIEWTETSPGTIEYPVIDEDLTITIIGQTENSNRATDNVVCSSVSTDASPLAWIKTFNNILRIAKSKITDFDVIIKDAEGNEAAIIYADQLEARYLIVDVSEYPSASCCVCDDGTSIMEVLYKPTLPIMSLDTDYFPIDGFDDIIVLKTKQLLTEMEEGKENRALLMHQKTKDMVNQFSQNKTGNIPKKLTFKGKRMLDHSGGGCY